MSSSLRVAIVGATGLVGEALLRVLDARRFPVSSLALFAGARSSGSKVHALGAHHNVLEVDDRAPDFSNIDLAFFAAGSAAKIVCGDLRRAMHLLRHPVCPLRKKRCFERSFSALPGAST